MIIKALNKSYGDLRIFEDFSVEFEEMKTTAVMGASGVGKSTLLNAIAGLTDYTGEIIKEGDISVVFSEPALLKNLSVVKNLEYAVSHAYPDKKIPEEKLNEVLEAVELADRRDALPYELSTGMAQRVALARGFLYPSRYIVMDEAFRGLDTALKFRLKRYFLNLLSLNPRTVIMITHDLDEALSLSDRVMVLSSRPVRTALDMTLTSDKRVRSATDPDYLKAASEYMRFIEASI